MGARDAPINDSKGCGGVMRAAPVGLMAGDPEAAFELGCDVAALTHGHPSGWLPAGALAAIVAAVVAGSDVAAAVRTARELLVEQRRHDETVQALDRAVALAASGPPAPEDLERLGGAWVGEEALAIAVACALGVEHPAAAVLAAVNHGGDSDSTGAICGNIVGALHGTAAFPPAWRHDLDVADLVLAVADDLWTERFEPPSDRWGTPTAAWFARYPGA
jgi:ADP-ribosylglycohydrolase